MAFANDLVVTTEESLRMKIPLEQCKQFFEMKGVAVNVGKCASLKSLPVKGKKSMKVVTRTHRY